MQSFFEVSKNHYFKIFGRALVDEELKNFVFCDKNPFDKTRDFFVFSKGPKVS